MLISENDPWLSFEDAQVLAKAWKIKPINLGAVGHVNVASGFGPFPEIEQYLISERLCTISAKLMRASIIFKFAF